jgi:hypothetical protein
MSSLRTFSMRIARQCTSPRLRQRVFLLSFRDCHRTYIAKVRISELFNPPLTYLNNRSVSQSAADQRHAEAARAGTLQRQRCDGSGAACADGSGAPAGGLEPAQPSSARVASANSALSLARGNRCPHTRAELAWRRFHQTPAMLSAREAHQQSFRKPPFPSRL